MLKGAFPKASLSDFHHLSLQGSLVSFSQLGSWLPLNKIKALLLGRKEAWNLAGGLPKVGQGAGNKESEKEIIILGVTYAPHFLCVFFHLST